MNYGLLQNLTYMHELAKSVIPIEAAQNATQAAIIDKIEELSKTLSAGAIKRIIRDVQYELTAAWKFFMGMGKDKQALVLLDGFTTLPLSLARNCAFAIVYGLLPDETDLFRDLAIKKGISNYSCIEDLTELATKFDLIVSAGTKPENSILFLKKDEISRLIHPHTEFWIITSNQLSFGYAKEAIRTILKKARGKKTSKKNPVLDGVRFQFGHARPILTHQAWAYLTEIECKPYKTIGLSPTIVDARVAKPLAQKRKQSGSENTKSAWQRVLTEDVVVGAAMKEPAQNFLERFLEYIPEAGLKEGKLEKYVISAGGKVLLFVTFNQDGKSSKTIVKLPLNALAERKLLKNHRFLEHFSGFREIGDNRRSFFPQALNASQFEHQQYFIESRLAGASGDTFTLSKAEQDRLAHEIFSFWIGIQKSYARRYYFDEETFTQNVALPLANVLAFFKKQQDYEDVYEKMIVYLRERLLQREIVLSLIHGDFSEKNIILDAENYTLKGIIDWDMAGYTAFPILDVFHYFARLKKTSNGRSTVARLFHLLEKRNDNTRFKEVLRLYQDSFSLEQSDLTACVMIYWIYRMNGHLDTLKYMDKSFVRRNFTEPMKLFEKHLS
ncbi:MAG: phosphotransferase family protein [bacterium]